MILAIQKKHFWVILLGLLCVSNSWAQHEVKDLYDYRNTHWFGLSGGSITGPGLSYMHWGESMGLKISMLPFFASRSGHRDDYLLSLGGAALFSINQPKASTAGIFGFTNHHAYWFVAGMRGSYGDEYESNTLTTVSGGIGFDLNRRDSRLSFMIGVGPYLIASTTDPTEIQFFPTLEVSWHFGAARRAKP